MQKKYIKRHFKMIKKRFNGVVVPMVTPFSQDFKVDEAAVTRITAHITSYGAHPFVLGTTGESASIAKEERIKLVAAVVKASPDTSTVYAGISGNCLSEVIAEAKLFADLGIDALVSTMPSYYPVDGDQMLRYFEQLADEVPLPLIIYNIPATTHLSIPLDVVAQLSQHPNILGFKDSEKGEERMIDAISRWKDREDFSYLLGWALKSQQAMFLGADGIVPSTGNLAPGLYQSIFDAAATENLSLAKAAQVKADYLSEIYQKDRILSKSLPVLKIMMAAYGLCETAVLAPLYQLPAEEEGAVTARMLKEFENIININTINENE